jgi:hypothetical protein
LLAPIIFLLLGFNGLCAVSWGHATLAATLPKSYLMLRPRAILSTSYQEQFCYPNCYPSIKMGSASSANPLISLEPARGVEPLAC